VVFVISRGSTLFNEAIVVIAYYSCYVPVQNSQSDKFKRRNSKTNIFLNSSWYQTTQAIVDISLFN
jgi:hypothetical protein